MGEGVGGRINLYQQPQVPIDTNKNQMYKICVNTGGLPAHAVHGLLLTQS